MMTVMMVIMFFIVLSGENISTQIVTEKSTKLVEYLLVNVRPLDLVCGKILASVIVSLIQILVMVGSGLLSIVFCKKIGIISSYEDTLTLLKLGEFTDEISAMDIALIVVFLVVGFLFYAIIMCMLSSTVSRLEDLSNAQMIFSVIIIVVMYSIMGIMTVNDMDTTQAIYKVLIMLPFTSVFVTPQLIMLGKISISFVVIAVIAQIIFIVIFGKAAAKVYISLIMYSGKKLSIKQIWSIVKGSKVGEAHE
jgi:ABC-2 type transport system permease protein